jgi:hypothetical protein
MFGPMDFMNSGIENKGTGGKTSALVSLVIAALFGTSMYSARLFVSGLFIAAPLSPIVSLTLFLHAAHGPK